MKKPLDLAFGLKHLKGKNRNAHTEVLYSRNQTLALVVFFSSRVFAFCAFSLHHVDPNLVKETDTQDNTAKTKEHRKISALHASGHSVKGAIMHHAATKSQTGYPTCPFMNHRTVGPQECSSPRFSLLLLVTIFI